MKVVLLNIAVVVFRAALIVPLAVISDPYPHP